VVARQEASKRKEPHSRIVFKAVGTLQRGLK
jgi:hypothetical protein